MKTSALNWNLIANSILYIFVIVAAVYLRHQARKIRSIKAQLSIANKELQNKQIFFESIFENTRECIKVLDLDGKLSFMNGGGQKLLEICDFAPLKGANWVEFWEGNDKDSAVAAIEAAKLGGVGQFTGYFPTVQSKTPKWFEVVITAMRDRQGLPSELLVVSRDVTSRREAEESIKNSEVQLKTLAESIPQIVWTATPDGNLDYYNQRWFDYTGMTLEQTKGWGWEPVLHPEDLQNCVTCWTHAIKTGELYEVEYRFKRALDGAYRWHLGRAMPVRDSQGLIVKWFGTCTDIHDQKTITDERISHAAQELASIEVERSKNFLDHIINNLPAMIFIKEAKDLKYIRINKAIEEFMGCTEVDFLGKNDYDFFSKEQADVYFSKDRAVMASTGKIEIREVQIENSKGMRSLRSKIMALTGPDGNQYLLGISEDVTDQKTLEEKLLNAHEEAISASKMKSEFVATLSHEIRTPLNGVIGMTSLLLDTELSTEQRDYGEIIRSSASTLLTLVNDILDLSKAEAGKIDLDIINFDLGQVVVDIERTLGLSAKNKGLKLLKSIEMDLPPYLKGDPTRLRQVLSNLVNNAIKFTSHGSVTIEIHKEKQTSNQILLRIEVTDTGIGIPEISLGRMFQAFSQADASTTRKFGGTGLGLSISKHLVTMMGGEIGVKSIAGMGSTFWFTLPVEIGSSQLAEASALEEVSVKVQSKLRILVAEDNSVNQLIAIKMLEKLGHTAVAVANGKEALDALSIAPYDLVFMDCQMPEMDGYEATKLIRNSKNLKCNDIPIIAMTANAMAGDREKCIEAGMNDYVSKPMKVKDLSMAIERNIIVKLKSA